MRPYEVIGLLYTRTCPLACAHCIIESSPKAADKMQFDAAMEMLPTVARYATTVCFTGGEPLLYYTEIVKLIEAAKDLGLVTSLVSGAGWVRKRAVVEQRVARLRKAGLDKLCVSADRYHEAYSPRERAHLLIEVAQQAGINVVVRGVIPATLKSCAEKERFAPGNVAYDPVPLVRLGAARTLPEEHFYHYENPPKGPCKLALWPVIEPSGNVYTCCGPSRFAGESSPLILGNVSSESLEAILLRGSTDPLLKALSLVGPYGLLEILKSHPSTQDLVSLRPSYTGMCELCLDLTDSLEIVAAVRNRLTQRDAQALLVASSLWAQRASIESSRSQLPVPGPKELSNVTHFQLQSF